ncbi:MAG TPA: alpha-L-rhamnosidase C-terminal domain-containing protein [Flavisolibacter sp.]|nr:alpha-L-rhamnosidase C-terminal domain-containing protein [Flavisolibacter sp.]
MFDCQWPGNAILSNGSWQCSVLKAFKTCEEPKPNFRLPESSILFDAREDIGSWQTDTTINLSSATVVGKAGEAPWNKLVQRPIPQWKDFGVKPLGKPLVISTALADTLIYRLSYNAQFTPFIKVDSKAEGQTLKFFTDNYLIYHGGATGLRSEYITKKGLQQFENPGWLNGHRLYCVIPKGVKVIEAGYRETGYNTDFAGSFSCSDSFMNNLWQKCLRTLYLTMRDNYMDCPERERAQWTGDAVNESGEAFYALDTRSHLLSKKWLNEFADWQRTDSSLYSPVPSGNWSLELPDQSLSTIGYYGVWNYFMHTADTATLENVYAAAKKYLTLWKINEKGTVAFRKAGWAWGDWGDNKDMELIFNLLYYTTVKGMLLSAEVLQKSSDAAQYAAIMKKFKQSFNEQFWNGKVYRHPQYKLLDDDRVQALAVVSGIADKEKYPAILKVLTEQMHASPYMEKYVMEAFFVMGYDSRGLARTRLRFAEMVNNNYFTTLWEGWKPNHQDYGGGTVNHGWSGGALTVLSQYVTGISPTTPGYKKFQVLPQPAGLKNASAIVQSVAGEIRAAFSNEPKRFLLQVMVPVSTSAIMGVPADGITTIKLNGETVWKNGKATKAGVVFSDDDNKYIKILKGPGEWKIEASK